MTKTAKQTEASVEKSSITSQGCRIRLQLPPYARCVLNCKAVIANNWRAPLSTVAFVQMPWTVLEEACLLIRGRLFRPLAEAISLLVPTFETGFAELFFPSGSQNCQNCVQRLRPVRVMKISSSVPSRRLREFTCSGLVRSLG